jgi:5-methylcytosine-specific restriction endonuclease McrA
VATKTCSKCGEEKDVGHFYPTQAQPCKVCHRARQKAYAAKRQKTESAKLRAISRRWRAAHPDADRAYYQKNRSRCIARVKSRADRNPESIAAYQRRWRQENAVVVRGYWHRRRARVRNAHQGDPTLLAARLKEIYASPCARCGAPENIHADHVIPLSKGGHHAAYNLQPLCGSCNSSKGSRLTPLLPEKCGA